MDIQVSEEEPLWTRPYILTVLGTFFIFIPYSLYLPVLPVYILDKLQGSIQAAGLVNAFFLMASVLFRTQTARLENVYGKRNVLWTSCFLFFLSNVLYLVATNIIMIFIIRFFSGICFAIVNTSIMALGTQITPESRKGEGLAYLTTMVTAGTAIGPFLGLLISRSLGFNWVFLFCGLTTFIGLLMLFFIPTNNEKTQEKSILLSFKLDDILEIRAVPVSCIILFISLAYSGVLSFVTVYASKMNLLTASTYFFVVLAIFSIATRLLTGRIFDRFGPNVVIYPSILIFAVGLLLLSQADTSLIMLIAAALIGTAYGIAVPSMQTIAVQQSLKSRTSVVTATYFTFLDIGLGIGSYILGSFISTLGYPNLYLLLSLFVACISVLYFIVHGKKVMKENTANLM